jgi:biotin/methionine sulfoxide reductase
VIVNEPFWTATARHADIVLPATTPLERNDIGGASSDNFIVAMKQAIAPVGEARNDYDIFAGLAGRLNVEAVFTEGLDEAGWLRRLYEDFRRRFNDVPDFDSFWAQNHLEFTDAVPGASHKVLLGDFRRDPQAHPLPTPSGRIEIFSETIAGFGYDDCPGHPTWMEPYERLGRAEGAYPLHLISNQPKTRLHSQWDHGEVSREAKVAGREVMTLNPVDAGVRGIAAGDLVRVFNDRGQCLASAVLSEAVMPGAVVLPTGAWFDPAVKDAGNGQRLERHGNPNVLTRDHGTSRLAQGPSAHTCLVEVERWQGPAPALAVTEPPAVSAA